MSGRRPVRRRRARRAASLAVVLGVYAAAACTGDPTVPAETAGSAPTDQRQEASSDASAGAPAGSSTGRPTPSRPPSDVADGVDGGDDDERLVVLFFGVEPVGPDDAAAVAAGRIPSSVRLLDDPTTTVVSTTLTCRMRAQRVLEVPVRRDGQRELRRSARVVARLAGGSDVAVLGPRTDLAILLVRDRRGRVRARAAAEQIDDRWFVGEVEDCRGGV